MSLRKVLLVEDEPSVSALLSRFLTRAGFDVVCCTDGATALARWDRGFSLAVVDLGLPDMAGEQLVELLLNSWEAPVVVSSGTPVEPMRWGRHASVVSVLQKPYLPQELLELAEALTAL